MGLKSKNIHESLPIIEDVLKEYHLWEWGELRDQISTLINYCRSHYLINPTISKIKNIADYYQYEFENEDEVFVAVMAIFSRLEKHFEVQHDE